MLRHMELCTLTLLDANLAQACLQLTLERSSLSSELSMVAELVASLASCFSFLLLHEQLVKQELPRKDPSHERVLGEVTSQQPIEEGESFREADKRREGEGRQHGCSLVHGTKGETQLEVTRPLSSTHGSEAWRQLTKSSHFKRLGSLLNTSFGDHPASCLQQFHAWKEQVEIYQQLAGEQLPDSVLLSAVLNGLAEKVRHFLLLRLDEDSSFSDLDQLLAIYFSGVNAEQEFSLNMIENRACTDKPEEKGEQNRVDDQESNTTFQQKQEQDKQKLAGGGTGKGKGTTKEKGEAYKPQPPAYRGKGEPNQLPNSAQRACRDKPEEPKRKRQEPNKRRACRVKPEETTEKGNTNPKAPRACTDKRREQNRVDNQETTTSFQQQQEQDRPKLAKRGKWCLVCWKRGHSTQACWWNDSSAQQKPTHLKEQAWHRPSRKS